MERLPVPPPPPGRRHGQWPVVAAVAAGGGLGSAARYAAALRWPAPPDGVPWATFGVNVSGCALIGVLLVLLTEVRAGHPLLRPFLGTGVLGGYTTFSAYGLDVRALAEAGRAGAAAAYAAGTLAGALAAVWLAAGATRRATRVAP
jgi:CrcB protein